MPTTRRAGKPSTPPPSTTFPAMRQEQRVGAYASVYEAATRPSRATSPSTLADRMSSNQRLYAELLVAFFIYGEFILSCTMTGVLGITRPEIFLSLLLPGVFINNVSLLLVGCAVHCP